MLIIINFKIYYILKVLHVYNPFLSKTIFMAETLNWFLRFYYEKPYFLRYIRLTKILSIKNFESVLGKKLSEDWC